MATVSFLWHLHQPAYRTADGTSHAPWAAVHAGGAYTTLASAIEHTAASGQVVNIVPTLLEQLLAYSDGTVSDPVLEAMLTPATELDDRQREILVSWGFHVNPRQLVRYPRLAELARQRPQVISKKSLKGRFGPADLRDLQVLFVLAHAGEQARTDARLRPLHERGKGFSADDHRQMADWIRAQPSELIELWQRIETEGLSVREAEALARTHGRPKVTRESRVRSLDDPNVRALESTLQDALGTRVQVRPKATGGTIEIEYYSEDDLDRIVTRIVRP